jgi:hypothetical protein
MGQDKQSTHRLNYRPGLETLEDRCCPSVFVAQTGPILQILGNNASDMVSLVVTNTVATVTANNIPQTFFGIQGINAQLGGGNDAFFLTVNSLLPSIFGSNPAVQSSLNQNRAVMALLMQDPFLSGAFRGFGQLALSVQVDGGPGLDTFFASLSPFTPVSLNLPNVEMAFPPFTFGVGISPGFSTFGIPGTTGVGLSPGVTSPGIATSPFGLGIPSLGVPGFGSPPLGTTVGTTPFTLSSSFAMMTFPTALTPGIPATFFASPFAVTGATIPLVGRF